MTKHILSLILISTFFFGCTRTDWPYYKADVSGGLVSNKNRVEIPIHENISISVSTVCYPRDKKNYGTYSKGYQHCHIVIYPFGPPAMALEFDSFQFVAQDVNKSKILFSTEAYELSRVSASSPRSGIVSRNAIMVKLKYDMPPKQFLLHIPALLVDGKVYSVPEVIFTHTENIEYVPFFANY